MSLQCRHPTYPILVSPLSPWHTAMYGPSHPRARQLSQATGGAVLIGKPPPNQNDRTLQLRISCRATVVR